MTSRPAPSGVPAGALTGASVWLAYGAVEHALAAVAPRLLHAGAGHRFLEHELGALLLALYAVTGAALGAIAAAALPRLRPGALATAALGLAVVLHAGAGMGAKPSGSALVVLAVAAAVTVAAGLGRFPVPPFSAALLLTVPAWITKDALAASTDPVRIGASAAACAAIVGVSWALRGVRVPQATAAGLAVLALAAGMAMNRLPGRATGDADLPDVVLVVLDTVRADHLSALGYERETSPVLARLAAESALCTRAIAAGDMTLSTHASLFTGLTVREHGAHHPDPEGGTGPPPPLAGGFETLAERLRAAGYRTLGVTANHGYLSPHFGLDQGFDYWDARRSTAWSAERYWLRSRALALLGRAPATSLDGHRPFRSADEINREVFALLRRADAGAGPFFLFVNYMDAHFPYLPPPPFDDRFPGRDPALSTDALDRHRRDVLLRGGTITEAERAHLVSQYDGGIAYADSRLGMLVERLQREGLWDSTVLIVTSDHGEAFGERGLVDHGVSAYQDQVHVPLLVRTPDGPRGAVVDRTVGTVDVLPTVLAAAGLPPDGDLPGRNVLAPSDPRPVLAEHYPFEAMVRERPSPVQRALVAGAAKLVRSTGLPDELYDLAADPDETVDRAAEDPATTGAMAAALDAWLAATEAGAGGDPAPLDREVRERLEALGYVQ